MTARLLWTSEVGKQKRWRMFAPLCCRAEMNEKGTSIIRWGVEQLLLRLFFI